MISMAEPGLGNGINQDERPQRRCNDLGRRGGSTSRETHMVRLSLAEFNADPEKGGATYGYVCASSAFMCSLL